MTGGKKVADTSLKDIATSPQLAAIFTHLAAAAFGGWAFLTRFGQEIDDSPLCNNVVAGSGHPCIPLSNWQQSTQLELALVGLVLVIAAAAITFYNQERGDE